MTLEALHRYHNPRPLDAADRAALSAKGVAAAVAVASRHGIRVTDPHVLADRYALRVHLRPAPLVARVSTLTAVLRHPVDAWLARELDVAGFLGGVGAPVVPPTALMPPGPHLQDGFALSFWTYEAPVTDTPPGPEVAGRMLAELHAALRAYPGELPLLAPPLNDIPRGLARLETLPDVVPPSEVAMLRRVADRLLPLATRLEAPHQPLHGDAHADNLLPSARGPLWNDFEDVCSGPIAWDLSTLSDPEGTMLAAYADAPPAEVLVTLRRLRLLHGAVWVLALQPELDEWAVHARAMLDALRPWA